MTTISPPDRAALWHERLLAHREDHAFVRARFGLDPDPDFAARVLASYDPAPWAQGSIGVLDAMMLRDMIHGVHPDRVIEIGTAAGTSAVLLARVIRECGCASPDHPAVFTYDLHPWCFFDRTRPVGSAIDEAEPDTAAMIARHINTTALDAGEALAGAGIRLAFVDADHRHPAPIVDVLALLPAMAPGGWIVLHDVNLPAAAEHYEQTRGTRVDWKQHGAKYLFDAWPYDKLVLPMHKNIGAVRLPTDRTISGADFAACLDNPALPWEMNPSDASLRLLSR